MICVEKEILRDISYNQLDLRFVCHAGKSFMNLKSKISSRYNLHLNNFNSNQIE